MALGLMNREGHLEEVAGLLERGEDDFLGRLVEAGSVLLLSNVGVAVKDQEGDTALHAAASQGHVGVSSLLLGKGAGVDDTNYSLWTPLHCAASGGHVEVSSLLLGEGARVDSTNQDGDTPLHLAGVFLSYLIGSLYWIGSLSWIGSLYLVGSLHFDIGFS
jgi:ankyrin repeat protein